mmetsp:Transcript_1237/g.3598  ORF Transcript_1237/g.3598 Transcript_1237/m.3598 type:complete len:338 (-) Transcript_1237:597-1610(-)
MQGVLRGAGSFLQVPLVPLGLGCFRKSAADEVHVHSVDVDVVVPLVVQRCSDVLGHEVHSKNANVLTASLGRHVHGSVCHHEGVADMNVRPILLGCRQDALNFGVHVKVSNDSALGLLQRADEVVHLGLVGLEVSRLRLGVLSLRDQVLLRDHQRRKGLVDSTGNQLVNPLPHGIEYGEEAMPAVAAAQHGAQAPRHLLQEGLVDREEGLRRQLSRKVSAQQVAHALGDGAVAVPSKVHERILLADLAVDPNPRSAARHPLLLGELVLGEDELGRGAAQLDQPLQQRSRVRVVLDTEVRDQLDVEILDKTSSSRFLHGSFCLVNRTDEPRPPLPPAT